VLVAPGSHVGPHNGDSPLEEFLARVGPAGVDTFFHVSAGNDGLTGVAAHRELAANIPEFLKVRTGPNDALPTCKELLVESNTLYSSCVESTG
jgi:hypothetical protein